MSLHFAWPSGVRLIRELEYELAGNGWTTVQAHLLASGADRYVFDLLLVAAERLWDTVAERLSTGAEPERALSDLQTDTDLTAIGLPELLQEKLLESVKHAVARFLGYVGNAEFPGIARAAAISDLARVHAVQAGMSRFFRCSHFSPVPASAYTAMIIDPALNVGTLVDANLSDASRLLAQAANRLPIVTEDLTHAFNPDRVSAMRPRIFRNGKSEPRRSPAMASRYATMGFAALGAQILQDCPHKSALPTAHNTAGLTWSAGNQSHFAGFLKLLVKWFGERPVVTITEQDWRGFFAMLGRLPKQHHKSKFDRDRSLENICAVAAERVARGELSPDEIGIGDTATNRNISYCRTLYKFLNRHADTPEIHWAQFNRPRPKLSRDRAYTLEEMQQIFRTPVFTGRAAANGSIVRGKSVWHNASYWVLILAAYSGARLGELCGLLTADIKERDGIHYFEIRDEIFRSVKRIASIRDVPIHPEIVRLGFRDFVRTMEETGETRLFPELYSVGRPLSSGFIELVGKFLKRGLPFMGEGELLHPVRHFVSEELRLAEVPYDTRQALIGHEGNEKNSKRVQSLPNLVRLQKALAHLPVLTSHLSPHPIVLHPEVLRTRTQRRKRRPTPITGEKM